MNNQTLTAIFTVVGTRNGYDRVQAEFSPFRDFKVKWSGSYKWIEFEVSDYLCDAPEDVIESLAVTIFHRIRDDTHDNLMRYGDAVCEWITSDDFVRSKQPVFVRRFRGISLSTMGNHRDLAESYQRLVDMGLVERDPDIYLGWAAGGSSRAVGRASILMKVVAMSQLLDCDDVPDEVMDYCLYSQLAHVGMGFNRNGESRGSQYDALLSRFPDRAEMDSALRRFNMHI